MAPFSKYLPILFDIIKAINKEFAIKCANFFLKYENNARAQQHKLFIEHNGEEIAHMKFTIHRCATGIQINLNSFTNKPYRKRRYNLLLRTVLTCFGCTIKKVANIKGDFDLYSANADVIILHSIFKYFQPRLLYSDPTKQTIDARADIILLQTMTNNAEFLKTLGVLDVYVPLNAENEMFANLLLNRLLNGGDSSIIYPESIVAMDG